MSKEIFDFNDLKYHNVIDSVDLKQSVKKYSFMISGHSTSCSLEPIFYQHLQNIAQGNQVSITKIIEEIDMNRQCNLSSAIRLFVLQYLSLSILNKVENKS